MQKTLLPLKSLLIIAAILGPAPLIASDGPPKIFLRSYLPPGICQYSDAGLAVSVTGTPPLYYQWRYNSQDMAGETNSSIILKNVQPLADPDSALGPGSLEGYYDIVITNALGSITSAPPWLLYVAPVARVLTISISQSNAMVAWRGGQPPYYVERTADLAAGTWEPVTAPSNETNATVPIGPGTAFYRVMGSGSCNR